MSVPTVTTEAATFITQEEAILHGKVNPNGEHCESWWIYGVSSVSEKSTVHQNDGEGEAIIACFITQGGLLANKTYKFKLVSENVVTKTKVEGSELTFKTLKVELTKPANQASNEGKSVSLGVTASNYATISVEGMPTGMTFNTGTATFEGTPSVEGSFTIKIKAKGGGETKEVEFTWEITGETAPRTSGAVIIPSTWTFEITEDEPTGFTPVGEIYNVHKASVTAPLNKVRTASLEMRLDNPMASYIAENISQKPLFLKAYRASVLVFFGPLQTAELVGNENQSATMAITASGPEFIWPKRLVGKTADGLHIAAGTKRAVSFKELCETSMKDGEGFEKMNIDFTRYPITCTSSEEFEAQPYQDLATILKSMFEQATGFDWIVHPCEPTERTFESKKLWGIGSLHIEDHIHTERPNALLEWGAGRVNLNNFKHKIDLTTMLNRAYNFGSQGPETAGASTVSFEDTGAVEAAKIWGGREEVISLSILSEEARRKFLEEAVYIRMKTRQTIEFSPTIKLEGEHGPTRVPDFGIEYEVGDSIFARIKYEGVEIFEAMVRVWAWGATLDENGKETQALTLSAT